MVFPAFYVENLENNIERLTLDENTSRHIVHVLRMEKGEEVHLTDGKGQLLVAQIIDDHKKKCAVQVVNAFLTPAPSNKLSIGISFLKNGSRFEWFLEKATEIGVSDIIPLICERTERQQFREERLKNVMVSALLQSQQVWLPVLHQPISLPQLMRQQDVFQIPGKYIAHCLEGKKIPLSAARNKGFGNEIILIGPEGDFTKNEIELAFECHFVPVALGDTRLRTETAGVVAAAFLRMS